MPSNGTEGRAFEEWWCENCVRDAQFRKEYDETGNPQCDGCQILAEATSGIQPIEWAYRNGLPSCSAYSEDQNHVVRCTMTVDMFAQ